MPVCSAAVCSDRCISVACSIPHCRPVCMGAVSHSCRCRLERDERERGREREKFRDLARASDRRRDIVPRPSRDQIPSWITSPAATRWRREPRLPVVQRSKATPVAEGSVRGVKKRPRCALRAAQHVPLRRASTLCGATTLPSAMPASGTTPLATLLATCIMASVGASRKHSTSIQACIFIFSFFFSLEEKKERKKIYNQEGSP